MFICHFEEPQQGGNGTAPAQDGWLLTPSGEQIRFRVNDEGGARGDGVRVYAGVRSDPFFIDLAAFFETLQTGRLAFKEVGTNSVERRERLERCRGGRRAALAQGRPRAACSGRSPRRWSPASCRSASSASGAWRSRT